MKWTYQQSTGLMTDAGGSVSVYGYSGAGEGKNNPAMQDQHNVGPIPCGRYTITGPECTHGVPCGDCHGIQTHHHGPLVLRLTPDPSNEMFGRAGFLIHGDNQTHTASEGCIILPRTIREAICPTATESAELEVIP